LDLNLLLQQMIFGVTVGSTYALAGLGFTMIFRAMALVNFAHGELAMAGAFISLTLCVDFRVPFVLSFLIATLLVALLGMVLERTIYWPLQHHPETDLMIAFVAVSIVLKQLAIVFWGAEGKPYPSVFGEEPVRLGNLILVPQDIWIVVFSVMIMLILLFLFRTKLGWSMQAISQDRETALLMGINVPLLNNITFGISSALGAAAGILFAPLAVVYFNMGEMLLIKGFTAAILGGLGNVPGAVVGGFLFGVIEQVSAGFISSLYRDAVSFGVLLIFIVFRPAGLFGKKAIERA
jgi:branched-chain amino acid transport system permease protein